MSIRALRIAVLALAVATPALAQLPDKPSPEVAAAVAAYRAALARQCPAKHLEWLNPGILADPVDDFVENLTPARQAAEKRMFDKACGQTIAGAACGNVTAINAAHRFRQTARLAASVCATPQTCIAPFDCHATEP